MAKKISVGIDIGTYHIKVVVGEHVEGSRLPKIIGTGYSSSKGMRYGYIVNTSDVTKSLKKALGQAERSSGIPIKKAYVSIGGVSLEAVTSKGSTIISRGDNEITDLDVSNALEASEMSIPDSDIINRKVLHAIPIKYVIDNKEVLGRPAGMKGIKLEVQALFITCLEQHLNDLVQAVEDTGVIVEDIIAAPLAASIVTLSKAQKIAGCVLANIGSETVSIVVFEGNIPVSLGVFPIGSTDITNDIALGLKIPLDEAEQIKLGGITGTNISRKKLDEIIVARLTDIFEVIEAHLKKIKKAGMLPAGIILTGGGSGIATVEDLAKATLKLPSKIADLEYGNGKQRIKDSSWSVAYGLTVLGLTGDPDSTGIRLVNRGKKNIISWLKQFLP